MSAVVLKSSSTSATRDTEIYINKDRSTVYIDFHRGQELVAHFTMSRGDWETFILSEVAEIR